VGYTVADTAFGQYMYAGLECTFLCLSPVINSDTQCVILSYIQPIYCDVVADTAFGQYMYAGLECTFLCLSPVTNSDTQCVILSYIQPIYCDVV
jgi:hypothetical protein